RCGKAFLKAYLKDTGTKPLDFPPPFGFLSGRPEVDLFARFCAYGLSTTQDEREFLDHCLSLVVENPPEPEFFTTERYEPLFHRVPAASYRAKFVDVLVSDLDQRIRSAWLESHSNDDIWKLEALKQSIALIKADPRYSSDKTLDFKSRRLDDYISQV